MLAVQLALLPLYALRLFSHIAGRSTKTIKQLLKHPKRCTCACHICPKRIQNSKNPTLQLHWLDAYNLPGLCHSICVLESLPESHILSEPSAALAQIVRHHLRNKITFWGLGNWNIRSAVPNIQFWEIALFGNNTWRRTKLGTPNPRNRGTLEKEKSFTFILRKHPLLKSQRSSKVFSWKCPQDSCYPETKKESSRIVHSRSLITCSWLNLLKEPFLGDQGLGLSAWKNHLEIEVFLYHVDQYLHVYQIDLGHPPSWRLWPYSFNWSRNDSLKWQKRHPMIRCFKDIQHHPQWCNGGASLKFSCFWTKRTTKHLTKLLKYLPSAGFPKGWFVSPPHRETARQHLAICKPDVVQKAQKQPQSVFDTVAFVWWKQSKYFQPQRHSEHGAYQRISESTSYLFLVPSSGWVLRDLPWL